MAATDDRREPEGTPIQGWKMYGCHICGGLVDDLDLHRAWHELLSHKFEEAAATRRRLLEDEDD